MTDLPNDSPTHTGASQPLFASTDIYRTRDQKANDESDKEGTNRTRLLTERERTDCHNFPELYTGISRVRGRGRTAYQWDTKRWT